MANDFARKAASVDGTANQAPPATLVRQRGDEALDAPLLSLADALVSNAPLLAVQLEPADDARKLAPIVARLGLVAIHFPLFKDGRGYSSARILRDELGYTGELRATGDVLIDQLVFLKRSGFDAFALRKAEDAALVEKTLARFADVYQPASDARTPVWRRR